MSLEEKIPQYLSLLESESTPEYLKMSIRTVFIAMGTLIEGLQKEKIFQMDLPEQEEMFDTGKPTSHYVNQDPDLKEKVGFDANGSPVEEFDEKQSDR